jgi:SAM-dependent methyltransferase
VVHESAAVGFARSADAYERARPEYPDDAMAWLAERLGLGRGVTVVDLAAGTGKLTRRLLGTGATIVAVEPVAEMRAALPADATVHDGVAEAIPLGDATADALTVGQAFHWFDGDRALGEIHRVLRPGGGLALVWNRRHLGDPLQAAIQELLAPYRCDVPAHGTDQWRGAFERTSHFAPAQDREFAFVQRLDADGLADRVGSTSFIAALPERERAPVLERARALAAGGTVSLPYRCEVGTWVRRS